jgi:hypothetical protein
MYKKLIYLICLALVVSMAGDASGSLVAHWKLDDGSGTIAKDSAGGYDGTLIGDTKWVEGKIGGALQFDGDGDYVDCGNDPVFNPTASFSVGFWAFIANWETGWGRSMIAKGGDADRNGWSVRRFSDETICFTTAGVAGVGTTAAANDNTNMPGTNAPPLNEWAHIACIYDSINGMTYIYINGAVDKERAATGTVAATDAHLYIGTRGNTGGTGTDDWLESFFNGMLDEVRFYNHALTGVDVALIMAGKEALPPTLAANPKPANGATEIPRDVILSWGRGDFAQTHNVYFGTDVNDVRDANVAEPRGVLVSQNQTETTYDPNGLLDFNKTYYWRVDEINDVDPNSPWVGNVWSFTVANFTIVDDFEGYDDVNNLIYDTWQDYAANGTGMTVGHLNSPYAERNIVRSGRQAMYMRYDNDGTVNEGTNIEQTGTKFYSEAECQWGEAQDWTKDGANSLTIWSRGLLSAVGGFKQTGQNVTITAAGADMWGNSDQFHFVYKQLSGNGEISARVVSLASLDSNTPIHGAAKAGIIIRESLEPGSKYIMVDAQPSSDNGLQVLRREDTNFTTTQLFQLAGIVAPRYIRLVRNGNTFTAYQSSIGGTMWTSIGSVTMPMLADAYIGLIACSHNSNVACKAEFSTVKTTGATGSWQSQDIGIESNAVEQLYVALEDDAGNSVVVNNADPLATTLINWTAWNIPFTAFTDVNPPVNMQAIKKLSIGVGNRDATQPGGSGTLYIDDIRLYRP